MLDLGWSELLIIAVAALIVVGPKDLPRMLRTLGQYAARAKGVAREFQRSMDEAARQADLDELRDVKKDLDKDVAGVRDAQYQMQRDMSQSFLDDGKGANKGAKKADGKTGAGKADTGKADSGKADSGKADTAKAGTDKPAAGNGDGAAGKGANKGADKAAGKGDAARGDKTPGKAPASARPEAPAADEPARKPSAGKVGGA